MRFGGTAIGILPLVVLAAAACPVARAAGGGETFHAGGVGPCEGCHTMHGAAPAEDGAAVSGSSFLVAADPASTCLTCHQRAGNAAPAGYQVATAETDMPGGVPPAQLSPGGDFGWLKKTYRWNPGEEGGARESPGERHGHNIVAADYRFEADTTFPRAPGGAYPSGSLSCISCHDPHGRYRRLADGSVGTGGLPIRASGSYDDSPDPAKTAAVGVYRLLGGRGYTTAAARGEPFTADPPAAVSPSAYNRSEEAGDTRVAYGSGFSEWCANCHKNYVGSASRGRVHPAGADVKLTAEVIARYNAYIASGNMGGKTATAYTSMVPFETGGTDHALLKRTASSGGKMTAGPEQGAGVMCLSCHRAHASGWDFAMRWNAKAEFIVYGGEFPGVDADAVPARLSQGRTRAETAKTFYGRPPGAYAAHQRSLCNKCHAQD